MSTGDDPSLSETIREVVTEWERRGWWRGFGDGLWVGITLGCTVVPVLGILVGRAAVSVLM